MAGAINADCNCEYLMQIAFIFNSFLRRNVSIDSPMARWPA
jgi:hypothetical protein